MVVELLRTFTSDHYPYTTDYSLRPNTHLKCQVTYLWPGISLINLVLLSSPIKSSFHGIVTLNKR